MTTRVTVNRMLKEFSKRYPGLSERAKYYHQRDGLRLYVYFEDGTYVVYDYVAERVVSVIDPSDFPSHSVDDEFYHDISKDEWTNNFVSNLEGWRKRRGYSLKILAKVAGISYNSMCRYISGERTPSGYVISKLANTLGCSVEDLLL